MSGHDDDIPWEGRCLMTATTFASECAALTKSNPYGHQVAPLNDIMNTLMTELWDNGFSQTEIKTAFENAIRHMPRYAAGKERRGSN